MLKRDQTLSEEIANAITHGVGVLFSIIAFPSLLQRVADEGDFRHVAAILFFGLGLFAVYITSTLYHAIQIPSIKRKLNISDHMSIFLLIGGTYAPFVHQYTDDQTASIFLTTQWVIIVAGMILKVFFTEKYEWASLFLYVFLGLMIVFLIEPFSKNMHFAVFKWIFAGGISYCIGVFFYRWDKQKYAHTIWHLFVLGGSACHYIAIWKMYEIN
ncbi:MAG: PAQR family membrane homeostasis protein TrhA [Saprospiraceae bacterium]